MTKCWGGKSQSYVSHRVIELRENKKMEMKYEIQKMENGNKKWKNEIGRVKWKMENRK